MEKITRTYDGGSPAPAQLPKSLSQFARDLIDRDELLDLLALAEAEAKITSSGDFTIIEIKR